MTPLPPRGREPRTGKHASRAEVIPAQMFVGLEKSAALARPSQPGPKGGRGMRFTAPGKIVLGLALAGLLALSPSPMRGQDYRGQGAPPPGEIQQTVARISYIEGNDASYSRGDDPDDWQAAVPNLPITLGDRVYTGDSSRMEVQVHGGGLMRLAPRTDMTALN